MTDDVGFDGQVNLLAEVSALVSSAREANQRVAEAEVTVTAKGYLFTVTVGNGGRVSDFAFNDDRYRTLAPIELSGLIVSTLEQARLEYQQEVQGALDEHFPGRSAQIGEVDPGALLSNMLGRARGAGLDPDVVEELRRSTEAGR